MEKIKNFIYDKSDLLVALLIIGAAALVILFGIYNIMMPSAQASGAQASPITAEEQTTAPAVGTDTAVEPNLATTGEGVTSKAATIMILEDENSDQIAEKLLVSDVIIDKNEFYSKLEEMGLSAKIQKGTFEIPAGSTLEDVCKIITKTT